VNESKFSDFLIFSVFRGTNFITSGPEITRKVFGILGAEFPSFGGVKKLNFRPNNTPLPLKTHFQRPNETLGSF
jgi:hypothetical protein